MVLLATGLPRCPARSSPRKEDWVRGHVCGKPCGVHFVAVPGSDSVIIVWNDREYRRGFDLFWQGVIRAVLHQEREVTPAFQANP